MSSTTAARPNESSLEWTPLAALLNDHQGVGETASVLERNLRALARTSPGAVHQLRCATPRLDVKFLESRDGALAGEIDLTQDFGWNPATDGGGLRALCSRRAPLREADQIASQVDVSQVAAISVAGFGMGYHVAALARRLRRSGIMIVFEPDVALLRAVLERVDHSDWLASSNVLILTDPDDSPTLSAAMSGVEGLVMMGFALIEHPACSQRLGESRLRFHAKLQSVVEAVRTMVATTMMQVGATVRNLVSNLGWYTSCPGITDLAGAARGRHAFVVSAGPSLERNISQLLRPGVRENSVIIAAQTVLRPLLARGIRPHFVTALDHSDISARFYEGLSAADVEGITLVIEPKASPAIPLAFPGRIRCVQDRFLDSVLGEGLARPMGSIPPGATVAHLAYYLARHLGCDPVVLVGQDLGFTDGQYYAAGAAIHDVWSCELNEFSTLEMMEWTRIRRMGAHLRKVQDQQGRPIYTDAQMSTYLVQFERDFARDTAAGLGVIDATEGGVAKAHARCEPLARVVDRVTLASGAAAPPLCFGPCRQGSVELQADGQARLRDLRAGTARVARLCTQAESTLLEMLEHHHDQPRVNRLIARVHQLRERVEQAGEAYKLVHYLNQSGAFSRIRSDRAIHLSDAHSPLSRQRAEIERDLENVRQLGSAADSLGEIFAQCAPTRSANAGPVPRARAAARRSRRGSTPTPSTAGQAQRVWAVLGFGAPDAPSTGATADLDSLSRTLARLDACDGIEGIIVLARGGEPSAEELARCAPSKRVLLHPTGAATDLTRLERVAGLRAWSRECWRGGLSGATCYDEIFEPVATQGALRAVNGTAALIVGARWPLVDPRLCDAAIERFRADPDVFRMTFSQAAPGLAGCVISRPVIESFATLERACPDVPPIGLSLGYVPGSPVIDPVGTRACVTVEPCVRDIGQRFDHREADQFPVPASHSASDLVHALRSAPPAHAAAPSHLIMDVPALAGEPWPARAISELAAANPAALLTLHADIPSIDAASTLIGHALRHGLTVHVRVPADVGAPALRSLLSAAPHVLSVDFVRPESAVSSAAHDCCRRGADRAAATCRELLAELERSASLRGPHPRRRTRLVPRLVRCDATYELIEPFFDEWTTRLGTAVIDPLPMSIPGQRIQPLPLPRQYRERLARGTMTVGPDGSVPPDPHGAGTPAHPAAAGVASLSRDPLASCWRKVVLARTDLGSLGGPAAGGER